MEDHFPFVRPRILRWLWQQREALKIHQHRSASLPFLPSWRWEDEFHGFPRLQARQMTGSVVGATPLARHHSGGVGLRSSCHLCVPLGGTVSTSQDALVSHYHQKRLLSTRSLLLLNRRWALTRFVDQSTELELLEKWFPPVFFCFIFLNWSLIGSLHCDIDWLVMLQPARVENCCQLRLNCPKSEAHSFTRFIFRNSS